MLFYPSPQSNRDTQQWSFLLDRLCQQSDISHAVAVSSDGLRIAASKDLPVDMSDHLSAVTSGLASLTTSNANLLGVGPVSEIVVGMAGGHLVIMAIDDTALLTVLAAPNANMGAVAMAMGRFIDACGEILIPGQRQ